MNKLLPELLGEVIKHVDHLLNFALVCQLWHHTSIPHLKYAYLKYFSLPIPAIVLNAFKDKLDTYPILKIDRCDDYIDFVNLNHTTAPVMIGIDPYKRRFFVVRYEDLTKQRSNVVVIFQRYTDNDRWCGCGHYNFSLLFDTSYGSINYDQLKEMIDGKEIIVKERLVRLK